MDSETEILAKTLYGEARGEGISGLEAVANVILNRVKHPCWWGKSIQEVCLKPMQFSCWNTDDPNRKKLMEDLSADPVFNVCRRHGTFHQLFRCTRDLSFRAV
ncbi:MAG: cell wall hydrolase [Pseudomonadota bacterium]|nr:cell wall hydrolase [Pseudomonadota bacterium]